MSYTSLRNGVRIAEVEEAVKLILCEHVASEASTVHLGALLTNDLGSDVTLADAISWLMRYSSEWKRAAKCAGAAS